MVFRAISEFINNISGSSDYTAALATILVLIAILIVYIVVFKMGVFVIGYLMDYKGDPYMFRGVVQSPEDWSVGNGMHFYTNPMDHEKDEVRVILRSKNERNGIEFTWAVWINVQHDVTQDQSKPYIMHIFNKGGHVSEGGIVTNANDKYVNDGMALMTCPGMYVRYSSVSKAHEDELNRQMLIKQFNEGDIYGESDQKMQAVDDLRNKYEYVFTCNTMSPDSAMEIVTIPDIPINLWTYVVIRCVNYKLDVYLNGRIKKRVILSALPLQNYGDVHVCESNQDNKSLKMFDGKLSDMRYFNYALQARSIEYFTEKGPDLNPRRKSKYDEDGKPYYLTQRYHYADYVR